jgi:hypothetical protein
MLAAAAKKTDDPNAPLIAGNWCTWCKHGRAGNCTAKSQIAMEGLSVMTETTGQTSMIEAIKTGQITTGTMTGEQLTAILDVGQVVVKLIDQAKKEALSRLQAGQLVPGYEIGSGKKSRKWADEEDVVAAKLKGMRFKKDEIYPSKLVSPSAAEKREKLTERQLANLQGMIEEVPGKDAIVKSKITEATPEAMFQNIPKEIDFMNVDNLNFM